MRRWDILFPVTFDFALDWLRHYSPHGCLHLLRSVIPFKSWFSKNRILGPHDIYLFFLRSWLCIGFALIECRVIIWLHTGSKNYLLADCACIIDQCVIFICSVVVQIVNAIHLLVEPGKGAQTVVFVAENVC